MSKLYTFFMPILLSIANLFASLFGLPQYASIETIDMSKFNETPVFADEFDSDTLDRTKWNMHYAENGIRRGSYWDIDMAEVKDGNLIINTEYKEEGLNGKGAGWYTVGIDTRQTFQGTYGYYECRCIMPVGYGQWSAFWMMSDNMGNIDGTGTDGAEIDIMESAYWGDKFLKNSTIHTIHYDGYGEEHRSKNDGNWRIEGDPYNEYHTYGVEWNENGYTFYIDGKKTSETNFGGASQVPEYLLLSVELAGQNGVPKAEGFATGSIEDNGRDFKSEFIVDYVRVYSYK